MRGLHRKAGVRGWWLCALSIAFGVFASPGYAQECPFPANLPPGVRMPEQAGCQARPPEPSRQTPQASGKGGRQPGFIDLGDGAELRIGGQVDFEAAARRR